jgi:hypothetical protein
MDDFGQHITRIAEECSKLRPFKNSMRRRTFEDQETQAMVEAAFEYHGLLNNTLKRMSGRKGYAACKESFHADETLLDDFDVDSLRERFVKRTYNERMEDALPIVHKAYEMKKSNKFAEQFESWANGVAEGYDDAEDAQQWGKEPINVDDLADAFAEEIPLGVDAINATSAISGIINSDELESQLVAAAQESPTADARDIIIAWVYDNAPAVYQELMNEIGDVSSDEYGASGMDEPNVNEDSEGTKYGVYRRGGSIGAHKGLIKTFDTKEEAQEYAKRQRKHLTPGERSYYKMGYTVKAVKDEEINEGWGRGNDRVTLSDEPSTYWAGTGQLQKEYDALYNELVPSMGKADTIEGEVLRAASKIVYRHYNDGDEFNQASFEQLVPYIGAVTSYDDLAHKATEFAIKANGNYTPNPSWDSLDVMEYGPTQDDDDYDDEDEYYDQDNTDNWDDEEDDEEDEDLDESVEELNINSLKNGDVVDIVYVKNPKNQDAFSTYDAQIVQIKNNKIYFKDPQHPDSLLSRVISDFDNNFKIYKKTIDEGINWPKEVPSDASQEQDDEDNPHPYGHEEESYDEDNVEAIQTAILRRILGNINQHSELLKKAGPDGVMNAARDVASFHAPVDELGSSDISIMVREVYNEVGVEYPELNEGRMKEVATDIEELSNKQFYAKYKMSKDDMKAKLAEDVNVDYVNKKEKLAKAGAHRAPKQPEQSFMDKVKSTAKGAAAWVQGKDDSMYESDENLAEMRKLAGLK